MNDAINGVLLDDAAFLSENAEFLLRELQAMLLEDGLLSHKDVVVVAAKVAYDEYRTHAGYICQPTRSFRNGLRRIGFYTGKAIQKEFPMILAQKKEVLITHETATALQAASDENDRLVGAFIGGILDGGVRTGGETNQIFVLSSIDDERTLVLPSKIVHSRLGAWTQGQRYVSEANLKQHPSDTRDFDAD